MDGADVVEQVMKLGLTGASILANVLLYRRMDKAETNYDALQEKRILEKEAMLSKLLAGEEK